MSLFRACQLCDRRHDALAVGLKCLLFTVVLQINRELVDTQRLELFEATHMFICATKDAESVNNFVGHEGRVAIAGATVLGDGEIVLMHDTKTQTAAMLPAGMP